ncbi:hypothetical protein V6N13_051671 [Hibiscus sabdariffa]|uniref:Uncharacterized protein n=1 Tax=Hibiscus sabdariffa TaxID=183260 RepID=A0ABR2T431_9ROSI
MERVDLKPEERKGSVRTSVEKTSQSKNSNRPLCTSLLSQDPSPMQDDSREREDTPPSKPAENPVADDENPRRSKAPPSPPMTVSLDKSEIAHRPTT